MIFDVLHTQPDDGSLVFTVVDTATAIEVPLEPIVGFCRLVNSNLAQYFAPGDNLLLQFVSNNLPYGFGQGTGRHKITMVWLDNTDAVIPIPELADNSLFDIPEFCEGLRFPGDGLFIKTPVTPTGTHFNLAFTIVDCNVSMINAPAVLLGETLEAMYYLGVTHTLPMEFGS